MRPQAQLVFDGQSFNYAPVAPGTPGPSYAINLMGLLSPGKGMAMVGLSGTTYAQRAADAATRVDPHFKAFAANVVMDIAGPSDLQAGLTAAQILSAAESYADGRRAAGATQVVGFTVTPGTIPGTYSAAQDTVRQQYNPLLKASTHFDAVVDIAALPHAADPSNATYFYDGLHPTEALAVEIAQAAQATLAALGIA